MGDVAAQQDAATAREQAVALGEEVLDETDEKAHLFLGHQKGPKGGLWEHDGKRLTKEQFDATLQKQAIVLVGERFRLRCDVDLKTNVDSMCWGKLSRKAESA